MTHTVHSTPAVSRVPLCSSASLLGVIPFPLQIKPKGEVCRPLNGECDLIEYCNGTSPVCEEDFFILDGHPCGNDKWICLNGSCQNGGKQCRDLFGYGIFSHLTFLFKHFLGAEKKQMSLFCLVCGTENCI